MYAYVGSNYLELLDSRPSYSSQNLYVQPPTRDAGRLNRSLGGDEDKNNLMRIRRGPLVGQESQQQQQQPVTATAQQQQQGMIYDPPPPPRPPPPRPEGINEIIIMHTFVILTMQ